jgi:hypothetical protein
LLECGVEGSSLIGMSAEVERNAQPLSKMLAS